MIWQEDTFRSKINHPTLFDDKIMRALKHSTFFELVRAGARNPLFEWENNYGNHETASAREPNAATEKGTHPGTRRRSQRCA